MTDLNKIRDELAEKYQKEFFDFHTSGMTLAPYCNADHVATIYAAGFDAAIEHLAKQSVEFDAVKAIVKMEASEGPADFERELSLLNLLKWQHQQTAAIFEAKLAVAREAMRKALDQLEMFYFAKEQRRVDFADSELRQALEKLGGVK